MRAELDNFVYILSNSSKINWEIPIRHIIPSDYECTVPGDACLSGGGAYCDEFQFWYYIPWPEEIKQRTLKGKRKHSELISINCLEFIIIIISYNAVLDAIELLGYVANVPHPKSLILADNKSADSWTRKLASSSVIGKRLCRILCGMLMNQVLGLDSGYIRGDDNTCADAISRLVKDNLTHLTTLFQNFPNLSTYRRYHPAPELISVLFNALLNNSPEVPTQLRFKGHF